MPRQGETGVTEQSRAPVQDGTLGEYKLGWLRDGFSRGFCGCVFRSSFPQEVHQLVIHFLRVGPGDAVRPILHDRQARSLDQLGRSLSRCCDRHNPVRIAMNHQRRDVDP